MSEHDPVSFQLAGLGLRMYPGEYPVDEVILINISGHCMMHSQTVFQDCL